ARLAALIDELAATDPLDAQERYVELFDRGRATSLHLFEHVHGEARDRGQAMVDLNALYASHGLAISANELPDYLPAVLEYLSTRPIEEVREMLGDCAHVLRAVGEALAGNGSRYGAVLGAVLTLAGEPAFDFQPKPREGRVADTPDIDEEWVDEPVIFGPGCTDVKPKVQVVRFMNKVA
ncbi:MAG: nitrate reductase molybdenum cofactor assembly chaperone, partial [Burkholderiaceae bacterium]|nr:nitrate reductase molybdenum cofactor assembly chaperone [Burkholderiaceae bacterium]